MKLNHLNLTVDDVTAAHQFLQTYFGLQDLGTNKNMGFLTDESGMVLSLTHMKLAKESEVRYPGSFHIGFIQPSEERVNEINQRLRDDGFEVEAPHKAHGSWTFYFTAPGGFVIEVLC
ncbi:VOC family protein [Herpetosiphon giganteus]|uniref:VOC family protein n=1 Tax=Herpetosiphon giganteus TaxID=2029754 RepID=UPI00195BAC21|nr:VOC family protein [Herpetosiphon giganteus]MBM7845686.1 catechol-2,3-dioxygenase [Herpetosiphon giganteus]